MGIHGEPDDLKVWRFNGSWGGIVAASHQGLKRTSNEDRYGASATGLTFALADGMGGHPAGEIAAEAAVRSVINLLADGEQVVSPRAFVVEAIRHAQRDVAPLASLRRELPSPGSTLVVGRIDAKVRSVSIGWVGDSRAYFFADEQLARLTEDHALPTDGSLTQSIGGGSATSQGDVITFPVRSGAWVLLCSDGLHGYVSEEAIHAALVAAQGFREIAVRRLIGRAFARGAPDNVTCMIVSFA